MTRTEFERAVQEALRGLPRLIRDRMNNVAVVVEASPDEQTIEKMGLRGPDDLLGLYQGVPQDRRGFFYGSVLPDKITLYQKPIERRCSSRREVLETIRQVVIHEIGHYFGLDDERLQELSVGAEGGPPRDRQGR